ncbi:hypothetical protein [Gordonia sp. NPDC003376]
MNIVSWPSLNRRGAAVAATMVVGAVGSIIGVGDASAREVRPHDQVNYTWCGGGSVELWYWDATGDVQEEVVNMHDGCREYTYRAAAGSNHVATFITDERGGRVMCTIRVNGRLIDRRVVQADFSYTYAYCR